MLVFSNFNFIVDILLFLINEMNEPNEDLAQLARTKEYELRVIQEMRCKHLETMILDRENIIEENINIIEALKVDFEFNLKLLETRDSEISRLRTSLQCYEDRLSLLEGDRTALLNRLATLSERETKRIHDADEEKMIYKVS